MIQKAALSATEEAYLAMVQQEHAYAIRAADARRDERLKPLLADKQVPNGIAVNVEARTASSPAQLVWETPDIAPDPEKNEGPSSGGTAEAGM